MAPVVAIGKCFIWLSLGISTVLAKVLPPSFHHHISPLVVRQDQQLPKEACWTSCELGSKCGNGVCSIGTLVTRSDDFLSYAVANASDGVSHLDDNPLRKRSFRYTNNPNGAIATRRPTKKQTTEYVVPILNSNNGWDTYFGPVLPLFHDRGLDSADERAVSQFQAFGNMPFQIGTNGLMGCTVVVLISNEAVWMSHLWEAYSNGGDDSPSNLAFDQRVNSFMKGEPVGNPAPSPIQDNEEWRKEDPKYKFDFKVYVPPTGPGIDGARFGASRGQNTMLAIMAPVERGATSASASYRYPNHVASMRGTITDRLSKRPAFSDNRYVTLDPENVPGDEDKMFSSTRGTALFQYDPDYDGTGTGKRAWRMWLDGEFTEVKLR